MNTAFYALSILIEIMSMFGVAFTEIIENTSNNNYRASERLNTIYNAIKNSTAESKESYLMYYTENKHWGSYNSWRSLVTGVANDINTLASNSSMINGRLVTPDIPPKTITAIKWFAEMIYDKDVIIEISEGETVEGFDTHQNFGNFNPDLSESQFILNKLKTYKYDSTSFTSDAYTYWLRDNGLKQANTITRDTYNFENRYFNCIAISFRSLRKGGSGYLSSISGPNLLVIPFITNSPIGSRFTYTLSQNPSVTELDDNRYNTINIQLYGEDNLPFTGQAYILDCNAIQNSYDATTGVSYTLAEGTTVSNAFAINTNGSGTLTSNGIIHPYRGANNPMGYGNYDESHAIYITKLFTNFTYTDVNTTSGHLGGISKTVYTPTIIGTYASLVNSCILVDSNSTSTREQVAVTPRLSHSQLFSAGTDITKFPAATCLSLINWTTDTDPITGGDGNSAISNADKNTSDSDTDVSTTDDGNSLISVNNMFHVYRVTADELNDFASFLWSSDVSSTIKKMFSNPMDSIISLMAIPFSPEGGTTENIILAGNDSLVSAKRLHKFVFSFYMGSCKVPRVHNNFLDYSPYTKIMMYLPLIGFVDLDPNLVVGNSVSVEYKYEVLGGGFVATILTTGNGKKNYKIAEYGGNCATMLPLSGANWGRYYTGFAKTTLNSLSAAATGNAFGVASAAIDIATNGIDVMKSGNPVTNFAILSQINAYILVNTPVDDIPDYYSTYHGTISNAGLSKIGNASGFNIFDNFKLTVPTATESEKAEIESLLKSGVYV